MQEETLGSPWLVASISPICKMEIARSAPLDVKGQEESSVWAATVRYVGKAACSLPREAFPFLSIHFFLISSLDYFTNIVPVTNYSHQPYH